MPAELNTFEGEEVLKTVVESPEFTTVAVLEFIGGVERDRLAALQDPNVGKDVVIRLPLQDGEAAVLLSECDGFFRWEYPDSIEITGDDRPGGLGAAPAEYQNVLRFSRNPSSPLSIQTRNRKASASSANSC